MRTDSLGENHRDCNISMERTRFVQVARCQCTKILVENTFDTSAVIHYAFLSSKFNHCSSVVEPYCTGQTPHSFSAISHYALYWHRLDISGQDFKDRVLNSCAGIHAHTWKTSAPYWAFNAHSVQPGMRYEPQQFFKLTKIFRQTNVNI